MQKKRGHQIFMAFSYVQICVKIYQNQKRGNPPQKQNNHHHKNNFLITVYRYTYIYVGPLPQNNLTYPPT